jgi:lipid-binding SYLF domain-containing protein
MRRAIFLAGFLLSGLLVGLPRLAFAQAEEQALVDRATLTVQEMMSNGDPRMLHDAASGLQSAKAVMVCPRIFRAGFIIGGEGGSCVLMARDGAGSWSSPAFYGMGSGSLGFQIGVQDAQVILMIMTVKGLNAVLDSQFAIGADASIAVATIGAGIQGATTAAVGADIVTYARSRGLYAGISLSGSLVSARSESNQRYYGNNASPRQIVVDMAVHNPGSDPLRSALMRFGTRQPVAQSGGAMRSDAGPVVEAQPVPTVQREQLRAP